MWCPLYGTYLKTLTLSSKTQAISLSFFECSEILLIIYVTSVTDADVS